MRQSVSRLMLITIVLISSLATALFMGVSLWQDYAQRQTALENRIKVIKMTARRSIAEAVYHLDENQTRIVLESIAIVPDVLEVKVLDPDGEVFVAVDHDAALKAQHISEVVAPTVEMIGEYLIADQLDDNVIWAEEPLTKTVGGRELPIGTLRFSLTEKHVYSGIIYSAIVNTVSELGKLIILAVLLFMACQRLITQHIVDIARFLKNIDWADPEAQAKKTCTINRFLTDTDDELDTLVSRINEMHGMALETILEKSKEVEHFSNEVKNQQATALNNAQLSSLGQMAGGIAHEVNNPLTIIQGHCNLLKRQIGSGTPDQKRVDNSFQRISASIERITEVTSGMLAFSRNLEEKVVVDTTVDAVLAKINNVASLIFNPANINYSFDYQPIDRPLKTCEGRILQIATNLFTNGRDAVKVMPEGKRWVRLWMGLSADGDNLEIKVTDSGPGVPVANRSLIFEPFFTTKPVGEGAGLGLSICHGMAEDLGGQIVLCEQTPESTFSIQIPFEMPEIKKEESGKASAQDKADGGSPADSLPLAS